MVNLRDLAQTTWVVILVILVILSGTLGYLASSSRIITSTVTTTAPPVTSISTSITISEETITMYSGSITVLPSLQLNATVSPAIATSGQNISVAAEVYNSLPDGVTLNATSFVNPSQGPCALLTIASSVYSGYYSFSNISSATPLLLYNASQVIMCPAEFHFTYTFLPNSDNATVVTLPPFSLPTTSEIVNETTTLNGYWTKSGNSSYAFQNFGLGQYTVLVTDAWGQEVIGYFQVSCSPFGCDESTITVSSGETP